MTFRETPEETKQKECHRLIVELLGQEYVHLNLVGELKIHENLENSQTKVVCNVRVRGEDFPVVGVGKGPVDALYSSLSKMLLVEYCSLANFYFLEFGVYTNLLKKNRPPTHPNNASFIDALLIIRNGDGNDFVFRARDCSVIGASMRVAVSAIEYLVNLEEAVVKVYAALKDAENRNRDDLVRKFTNKLIQLVDRSSYEEVIRRQRESGDGEI